MTALQYLQFPLSVDLEDGQFAILEDADSGAWLAHNALGVPMYHYTFSAAERYRLDDALADAMRE